MDVESKNFFAVGKHYSKCDTVVDRMEKGLSIPYQRNTAQIGLGKFAYSFTHDINRLWVNCH